MNLGSKQLDSIAAAAAAAAASSAVQHARTNKSAFWPDYFLLNVHEKVSTKILCPNFFL
jgi:hypothetical protein